MNRGDEPKIHVHAPGGTAPSVACLSCASMPSMAQPEVVSHKVAKICYTLCLYAANAAADKQAMAAKGHSYYLCCRPLCRGC